MLCPRCNLEIPDDTTVCPYCVTTIQQPRVVIQNRPSAIAFASLILGLISLIAWCIFFIPLGLSLSELRNIKEGKSSKLGINYAYCGLVCSFIAILLIFINVVPGFFYAIVRSKITRVKDEQNLIIVALKDYYKEHKTFPIPDYDQQGYPMLPKSLTTPISYLSKLPHDPFSNQPNLPYHYFAGPAPETVKIYWIITSLGPDKTLNLDIANYNPDNLYWKNLSSASGNYDPTNGLFSSGDIWQKGPLINVKYLNYN